MSKKKPSDKSLSLKERMSLKHLYGTPELSEILMQAERITAARDAGPRNSAGELVNPTLGRKLH